MSYKNLVILTASYPYFNGEFFLEDELDIISTYYENIIILCVHPNINKEPKTLPKNTIVIPIDTRFTIFKKILAIKYVFHKNIREELFNVKKVFKIHVNLKVIKIILNEYLKANIILTSIEDLLSSKKINIDNTLFYAYWNDDKALALSLLKLKNPNSICICRAHRWEIEYEKQTPKYLPFKKLIFDTLNKVYTISEDGMNSLINLLGNKYASKIEVSRLGKKNNRKPIFEKTNSDFVICSCSIMIPRKRLKLVIEILSKLKTKNITWVHFGDGSERKFLEEYIKEIANHITIDFKGIVPNKYILDFYASNYVDLFINVSESEGIPVSIMEAQSASIPILATNVGGLSEIIDFENGFLIDKDIDIYNTAKIIDDYLMSSEDNKIFKRKKSHQNWLAKYDANVNYLMFNNKNKIL